MLRFLFTFCVYVEINFSLYLLHPIRSVNLIILVIPATIGSGRVNVFFLQHKMRCTKLMCTTHCTHCNIAWSNLDVISWKYRETWGDILRKSSEGHLGNNIGLDAATCLGKLSDSRDSLLVSFAGSNWKKSLQPIVKPWWWRDVEAPQSSPNQTHCTNITCYKFLKKWLRSQFQIIAYAFAIPRGAQL